MARKLEQLKNNLEAALGSRIVSLTQALGEITVVVNAADYLAAAQTLRDDPGLAFAQLMDLCGVDYSQYGDGRWNGARYAVVVMVEDGTSGGASCAPVARDIYRKLFNLDQPATNRTVVSTTR